LGAILAHLVFYVDGFSRSSFERVAPFSWLCPFLFDHSPREIVLFLPTSGFLKHAGSHQSVERFNSREIFSLILPMVVDDRSLENHARISFPIYMDSIVQTWLFFEKGKTIKEKKKKKNRKS